MSKGLSYGDSLFLIRRLFSLSVRNKLLTLPQRHPLRSMLQHLRKL